MTGTTELLTVGYGRWPATCRWDRLVSALEAAHIEVVVDIRISPASSNLDPTHHYGPRQWHVQSEGKGIAPGLQTLGIDYLWLAELGNPQKNDHAIRILQEHIADKSREWPVHRGMRLLRSLAIDQERRCCLMCACKDYQSCHRKVIAEAFADFVYAVQVCVTELS